MILNLAYTYNKSTQLGFKIRTFLAEFLIWGVSKWDKIVIVLFDYLGPRKSDNINPMLTITWFLYAN